MDRGSHKPDPVALAVPDGRAHRRLWNYYKQFNLPNPVFGLIRGDTLRQTRLIDSFVKSDITLLAELLMLGQFRELPEQLFLRRIHDESSVRANHRGGALLAWFDASQKGIQRWIPVQVRLTGECLRSVCRMPLPFGERLRCLGVTLWWRTWVTLTGYVLRTFSWLKALPRRAWRFVTGRWRNSKRSCTQ